MKLPLFFWFELASLLVAVLTVKKFRSSFLILFIPFLFLVCCTEAIGLYYKTVLNKNNNWVYNIYTLVEIPFWLLYYRSFAGPRQRSVMTVIIPAFVIWGLVNLIWIQGFHSFNNYTADLGLFLVILFSVIYFLNLVMNAAPDNLMRTASFWISSGCLFYYTGTFFYFALYPYLVSLQSKANNRLFSLINLNLILLLYTCIALGFILHKNQHDGISRNSN